MLSFRIEAGDLGLPWGAHADHWSAGRSRVRPFAHPAIEAYALATEGRLAFVVRERATTSRLAQPLDMLRVRPEAFDRHLEAALQWPLNVLVLTWRGGAEGPLWLRCGGWGTAPVCLVAQPGTLHGHWDVAELYRHLPAGVDFGRAAWQLAHVGAPYSRRTLFPGLQVLTERASARWDPARDRLQVDYPPALPAALPRALRDDADVLGAFEGLLGAGIARCLDPHTDIIATELSGGLDSAVVALTASRLGHRPVRTYGLIVPGETGRVQAERRNRLVEHIGAQDCALEAARHGLFSSSRRDGDDRIVPWGEYYHEAFLALLRRARADGAHAILTGIGGDEISILLRSELERSPDAPAMPLARPSYLTARAWDAVREQAQHGLDIAPAGAAARSVFEAAQAGTAVYLRAGVWPLYPYAAPELVQFCRSLPPAWRRGRRLQRELLARQGLPQRVWRPELPESFIPLFDQAMRRDARPFVESLFRESRLEAAGLVDTARLLAAYDRYCCGEDWSEADFLIAAVVLELTMRALPQGAPVGVEVPA